jgi:ribosomal protein L23
MSSMHWLSSASRLYSSNVAYDDETLSDSDGRSVKFVSMQKRRVPRPPYYRPPIYFPDVTLQMMKPSEAALSEIKATGWTREVAFKTTPNVTKPEIKALLESMYGMQVERVNTINYLGKKHVTFPKASSKFPKRHLWREDDYKKAYVIFKQPPGHPAAVAQDSKPQEEAREGMIDQLLAGLKLKREKSIEAVS